MLEKLLLRARAGHSAGGTDGRLWDAVTLALQMSVCSIGQIDLQSNLVQKAPAGAVRLETKPPAKA